MSSPQHTPWQVASRLVQHPCDATLAPTAVFDAIASLLKQTEVQQ